MIDPEAYAMCKQRGRHSGLLFDDGWKECKSCGMWFREVRSIEEREDVPPESEQSQFARLGADSADDSLEEIQKRLEAIQKGIKGEEDEGDPLGVREPRGKPKPKLPPMKKRA